MGYILPDLGRRTGPRDEKMAAACLGLDFRDLATILDPFRAMFRRFRARPLICDLNIVTCHNWDNPISETSTMCVETKTNVVLATEEMPAVETGQMSSAETRHMYNSEAGQRHVLPVHISTEKILPVSTGDIRPASTADI